MSVRKTTSGIDMKNDQGILPEDLDRGRRFVFLIIVFTLGHCVETVLSNNLAAGASNASWGSAIVRIVLAVALCIFLYRRAMWARWVFGALSAIGGLGYSTMVALQFIGILRPLYGGEAYVLMGLPFALVYMGFGAALFFSPYIDRYFRNSRSQTLSEGLAAG